MALFYVLVAASAGVMGTLAARPAAARPRGAQRVPAGRGVLEQRQLRAAGGAAGVRARGAGLCQRLLRRELDLQLHRRRPAGGQRRRSTCATRCAACCACPAVYGAVAAVADAGLRCHRARAGDAPDGAAERRGAAADDPGARHAARARDVAASGPAWWPWRSRSRSSLTPLAAFGLAHLVGLQGAALQAGVLQASMPTAVITTILALEFDGAINFVTSVVCAATLLSPLTLTLMIAYLQRLCWRLSPERVVHGSRIRQQCQPIAAPRRRSRRSRRQTARRCRCRAGRRARRRSRPA